MRAQADRLLCEQLCLAELVLLNKMEQMGDVAELAQLIELVEEVNQSATILECEHARVDLAAVLHVNAFSVVRALERDQMFLAAARASADAASANAVVGTASSTARPRKAGAAAFAFLTPPPDPGDPTGRAHLHAAFRSVGLEAAVDVDKADFDEWLEGVFMAHGARLYRAKGIVFFEGIAEPSVVQCVGSHIECESMDASELEPQALSRRLSRLVLIGRLSGLEDAFRDSWGELVGCG